MTVFLIFLCAALLLYILDLCRRLSQPNPFDRVLGKKPYVISSLRGRLRELSLSDTKYFAPNLLRIALAELFYLYPDETGLELRSHSRWRHDLSLLSSTSLQSIDLSRLPEIYNEEFYIAFPNAETLSVPPHSSSLRFDRYGNKRLRILELRCPSPIPAYTDMRQPNGSIIVSKDFTIRVPTMQLAAYQQAEIWQHLSFCTEDGISVPLRFEAIN